MKSNWKRNLALFLTGQGITLFGSMLVHYAVMWHITLKTQSGVMMTFIAIAGTLPMFFIAPFAGVWADRYNKKHIINIADAAIAFVTLIMAGAFSLGVDSAWLLLLCLIMRALGLGVQMPAVNALVPDLVPQEHLTRVNGISGSIQSIVMFASPMAGGALIAVLPIQALLFIDVITAAVGISILQFFVATPEHPRKSEHNADGGRLSGAKRYFAEISEGLQYVSQHSFLKRLLVIASLYNIMIAPASILSQLQVVRGWGDQVWNVLGFSFGPEQRLAALNVVYFTGMTLGGFVMGAWGGFKNKSRSMALSMTAQGAFAAGMGVMGLFGEFGLYLGCVLTTGFFVPVFTAPLIAILQSKIDPGFMGRVFSVLSMMSSLMMPLGMVLWGPLGDIVAIDWLLIGTGTFIFLMGFMFVLNKTLLIAGVPSTLEKEPL